MATPEKETETIAYLVFEPTDKDWPSDKMLITNIGEFRPGVPRGIAETQQEEARRLVKNGPDFKIADGPGDPSGLDKGTKRKTSEQVANDDAKAAADAASKPQPKK